MNDIETLKRQYVEALGLRSSDVKYKQIMSALKLQELVKERIKENEWFMNESHEWASFNAGRQEELLEFQSLVEDSEREESEK